MPLVSCPVGRDPLMLQRTIALSAVCLSLFLLQQSCLVAQPIPQTPSSSQGSWYRHPHGIYRIPIPAGWSVKSGFRGTAKDDQFDTIVDSSDSYAIICWRSSEKVDDAFSALEKYRKEKLIELAQYKDVHATGFSVDKTLMMRVIYENSDGRIVSRTSAVKNKQRVVINTVSCRGDVLGQLPKVVEDLLAKADFPDGGAPQPIENIRPVVAGPTTSMPKNVPGDYPIKADVRETQTAQIGPLGGKVELRSGIRLVVPPEALPKLSKVTVQQLNPGAFNGDEKSRFLYWIVHRRYQSLIVKLSFECRFRTQSPQTRRRRWLERSMPSLVCWNFARPGLSRVVPALNLL